MSITLKYYKPNSEGFYESPGKMVITKRKAYFPDEGQSSSELSAYIYTPVSSWIVIPQSNRKPIRRQVNFTFNEQEYKVGQKEVVSRLNWIQKQKLKWMYRDHWLQQRGNWFHVVLITLIISVMIGLVGLLEAFEIF